MSTWSGEDFEAPNEALVGVEVFSTFKKGSRKIGSATELRRDLLRDWLPALRNLVQKMKKGMSWSDDQKFTQTTQPIRNGHTLRCLKCGKHSKQKIRTKGVRL
jgi:hypothetical protein